MSLVFSIYGNLNAKHPGQILRTGQVSQRVDLQGQAGSEEVCILQVLDEFTQMVDVTTKEVQVRPILVMPEEVRLLVGEMGAIALPTGSTVRRHGTIEWLEVDDGTFEFMFSEPATLLYYLRPAWPYQEQTCRIVVE